jgi:hypothetical protein
VVLSENPTHKEVGWKEVTLTGEDRLLEAYVKINTTNYERVKIASKEIYEKHIPKLYYKENTEDDIKSVIQ